MDKMQTRQPCIAIRLHLATSSFLKRVLLFSVAMTKNNKQKRAKHLLAKTQNKRLASTQGAVKSNRELVQCESGSFQDSDPVT